MPEKMYSFRPKRVAVIGAGLSGLSAALTLLKHGHQVTVYEAAPQAGGRARGVQTAQAMLDNGQHLCIGAYHATLTLLKEAGVEVEKTFLRLPLALHLYDGAQRMSLTAPQWLPAPLHLLVGLLTARGLCWQSKWQALRWMHRMQRQGFKLSQDCTVASLFAEGKQTEQCIQLLWAPLCLAALNTPIALASAQIFLNVLRDSFIHRRTDSDFLIARHDLTQSLINPLIQRMLFLGGQLQLGTPVHGLHALPDAVEIEADNAEIAYDKVIVAVAPHQRKTLQMPTANMPNFEPRHYQPITTLYMQFEHTLCLPHPMLGLSQGWAQWVFDRGQCCQQPGLLAVVISAHATLPDKAKLIAQCIESLNVALSPHGLTLPDTPQWSKVITEKRATFSCNAGLKRLSMVTASPHIYMAGDDILNDYPATIEGAIRNGLQAALAVHQSSD